MSTGGTEGTISGGSLEAERSVVYGLTTLGVLEDKLKKLASDNRITFQTYDRTRMASRLVDAYSTIKKVLLDRGLTLVQISTWASGEEFQLDIATYWYGRDSGWGSKIEDERDWIKVFDRTEELRDTSVINNEDELLLESSKRGAVVFDLKKINEDLSIYT